MRLVLQAALHAIQAYFEHSVVRFETLLQSCAVVLQNEALQIVDEAGSVGGVGAEVSGQSLIVESGRGKANGQFDDLVVVHEFSFADQNSVFFLLGLVEEWHFGCVHDLFSVLCDHTAQNRVSVCISFEAVKDFNLVVDADSGGLSESLNAVCDFS